MKLINMNQLQNYKKTMSLPYVVKKASTKLQTVVT